MRTSRAAIYSITSEAEARDSPQRCVADWTKRRVKRNKQVRTRALWPHILDISQYRSRRFALKRKPLEVPSFRSPYVKSLGFPVDVGQAQINHIAGSQPKCSEH